MLTAKKKLGVDCHSRDSAGLVYVYPVVSRRSQGLSIGINLNTNNACNWRCVYCQVPNLKRGSSPRVDIKLLRNELKIFLSQVIKGDFLKEQVEPEFRRLNDIAISGNGEPTTVGNFDEVVEVISNIRDELAISPSVKSILITNGSLVYRDKVRKAIKNLGAMGGEIWFKVDSVTRSGLLIKNGIDVPISQMQKNFSLAASLCPTWIQTCVFGLDGQLPTDEERTHYLNFLSNLISQGVNIKGVYLYGVARKSQQIDSSRIVKPKPDWIEQFSKMIENLGLVCLAYS